MKRLLLLCFFLGAGIGSLYTARAQGTGGGCEGVTPDPDNPCPIDGGLSFLLVAGVVYGIKKYRTKSFDSTDTPNHLL